MELAGETFYDRRESGLDIKIQNQQVRPTPDGYSSPAYVRQPEGNGVAERTIRMLKEQLLWVRFFTTVEEPRLGLATFAAQYNNAWLRQRHGHKTPNQICAEQRGRATDVTSGLKMGP